jgi:hypothetical protein
MWKTIVLCASLFASVALGLAVAARWLEPAVLPPHRPLEAPEGVRALPALDNSDPPRTAVSSLSVANTGRQPTLH